MIMVDNKENKTRFTSTIDPQDVKILSLMRTAETSFRDGQMKKRWVMNRILPEHEDITEELLSEYIDVIIAMSKLQEYYSSFNPAYKKNKNKNKCCVIL